MADISATSPVIQAIASIGQQVSNTELSLTSKLASQLSVISGTIIGNDGQGNFLLKTDQGNISLKSALPLTYNSDIVIRVDNTNGGSGNTARVLSVNGEEINQDAPQNQPEPDVVSESALANTVSAEPATGEKLQQALSGPSVRAVVIQTTALPFAATDNPAATTPLPDASLRVNTPLIIHIPDPKEAVDANDGGAPPAIAKDTFKNNAPAITIPSTPEDEEETVPVAEAFILPAKVYAAYGKQANSYLPSPGESSENTATIVLAKLVSVDKNAHTATIATPDQEIVVKTDAAPLLAKLPPDTDIALETSPEEPASSTVPVTVPASLGEIASDWTIFKDIISTLTTDAKPAIQSDDTIQDTALPAQTVQNRPTSTSSPLPNLPVLGENFVSSSLAFMQNIAQGNYTAILGEDVINYLKDNGKNDLITKFTNEAASLGATLANPSAPQSPATPQWQAIIVPFMFQDTLQQARIYVKRDNEAKKNTVEGQNAAGTRFVVEVDLPETGGLQLDGLVKKNVAKTSFDLVVRTNNALPADQQKEITAIYHDAGAQTGFAGTIAFQTTPDFPVKPLDDIMKVHSPGIFA